MVFGVVIVGVVVFEVVGEWFAASNLGPLVGVVLVGGRVSVDVVVWFAAVGVLRRSSSLGAFRMLL